MNNDQVQVGLFEEFNDVYKPKGMSLSSKNGFNDYFLFNDLRNGYSTIHSWDIIETTARQKYICLLLLKNRRKKQYGNLDGNPLSLAHFQALDCSIIQHELDELVELGILSPEEYLFAIMVHDAALLTEAETALLQTCPNSEFTVDELKAQRLLKIRAVSVAKTIEDLKSKGIIECIEIRYDFKNTKISTGLFGINRIFLPTSDIHPTLVASDTNDYITLKPIDATDHEEYKARFLSEVYRTGDYRKLTKAEACEIQGFPKDFRLPESRARWMKLIGNSVSVPVIDRLCKAIIETGVFENES